MVAPAQRSLRGRWKPPDWPTARARLRRLGPAKSLDKRRRSCRHQHASPRLPTSHPPTPTLTHPRGHRRHPTEPRLEVGPRGTYTDQPAALQSARPDLHRKGYHLRHRPARCRLCLSFPSPPLQLSPPTTTFAPHQPILVTTPRSTISARQPTGDSFSRALVAGQARLRRASHSHGAQEKGGGP